MISPKQLLEIPDFKIDLQNEKLIIFVGSGFSLDCGNYNWVDLVKQIIIHLHRETQDKKYEGLKILLESGTDVLDILDLMEKSTVKRKMIEGLVNNIKDPIVSEKHKKLINISKKLITTNYDKLIEYNSEIEHIFTYDNLYHIAGIREKEEFILKLHGCINDPDKCILFRKQYDDIYTKESAAILKMEALIQDYTFLFLGFSFNDPYVKELFDRIDTILNGYSKIHYLVSTEDSLPSAKYIETVKIDNWDQVESLLNELEELKKKRVINELVTEGKLFEIDNDDDDFRDFIIDFHEKSPSYKPLVLGSGFKGIERKFKDMKCSPTMKINFDKRLSVRFPLITEILDTEDYIESDKKELITDLIITEYCKIDLSSYKSGDMVFETLVTNITKLYKNKIPLINGDRLRFYTKIFVAWVINECDIFNESIEDVI
ncbi:SIR2 family NAD-dependent protein deacylase [Bacillus cereus]|uniref:SIR2 family NAD-dependent protein deacylase n=1 Tax=Bacillus cereus TaxID=1396 RepID=UPI000BECAB1F|nr:SIR2 family protein [Bacillus cereus]PEE95570.1 SIR2 family protein [Bacillus cereus]PGN78693.1 SIR2 family protein [Bacillus cereus]